MPRRGRFCGGGGCNGGVGCSGGVGTAEVPSITASSSFIRGSPESLEGLYDVPEETLDELASSTTTEGGRREVDGSPDISTNLLSLQMSILEKAFPTDGANCRNLNCD
jgi:hypothetical protein